MFKLKQNSYILLLFPIATPQYQLIEQRLNEYCNIIYTKDLTLNQNGALNLINCAYLGEKWLSTFGDLTGLYAKYYYSFNTFRHIMKVYLIEPKIDLQIKEIKKKLRELCNNNSHALHINDTYEQTVFLTERLLYDNSENNLNERKFNKNLQLW